MKLVVTTVPKDNGIYDKLCSKITNEKYHINIGPLPPSQCGQMITEWLNSNGRMLNFYQWRNLKAAFTKCSSPLFTKIAFDEAMIWPSYMENHESILETSIDACLGVIFQRLEDKPWQAVFQSLHGLHYSFQTRSQPHRT